MYPGALLLGISLPGRESDNLPLPVPSLKMNRSVTPLSQHTFLAYVETTLLYFTFYL